MQTVNFIKQIMNARILGIYFFHMLLRVCMCKISLSQPVVMASYTLMSPRGNAEGGSLLGSVRAEPFCWLLLHKTQLCGGGRKAV